jgi:hypothetical protein
MRQPLLFLTTVLLAAQAFAKDLSPPKLECIVSGNSGVYVDLEKRDEELERKVRYCGYVSETADAVWLRMKDR